MSFVVPVPSESFDVELEDGAKIRVRRHGNPAGVRLTVTHGNGFAADAYLPFWQLLTPRLRRAGARLPQSRPEHSGRARQPQLRAARPRSRTRRAGDRCSPRQEAHRRHLPFHVGPRRHEARDRDRLALGRARAVRSAQRPAAEPSALRGDGGVREQADAMGARPPAPLRRGRRARERVSAVARHQGLGRGRARADGTLGAAPQPGRRRLRARLRAGERGRDLRRGADIEPVAARRKTSAGRSS